MPEFVAAIKFMHSFYMFLESFLAVWFTKT
jgi:hypothetical protein